MADAKQTIGTGTFIKLTGLPVPRMRELEAAGIINPIKTDSGWRAFSDADVRAALQWKQQRARAR
jgi:DNA-binding transcriptional MerR regulator